MRPSQSSSSPVIEPTNPVTVELAVAVYPSCSTPDGLASFRIRFDLRNTSASTLELQSRSWTLVDADHREVDLRGPCVPGQRPKLIPGATYSFSHEFRLVADWASLDGHFRLMDLGCGELMRLQLPRQILATGLGRARRAGLGNREVVQA